MTGRATRARWLRVGLSLLVFGSLGLGLLQLFLPESNLFPGILVGPAAGLGLVILLVLAIAWIVERSVERRSPPRAP